MQAQVASDNANIVRHDLSDLFHILCYKHLLLIGHRPFIVPLGNLLIKGIFVDVSDGVLCGFISIYDGFDEGVTGQTVATVQTGTGAFANSVETVDGGLSVQIDLDTAAHVMGTGHHGNILLRDINSDTQALGVDIGEVMFGLLGILVGDVKAYVIDTVNLHLLIDGAGNDIAGSEREALVVLLHKLLAIRKSQDTTVAAHGLRDKIGGMGLRRIVERSGVELHEFHVLHDTFSTINHRYAIPRCNIRICGGGVDGTRASCCHQGDT